MMPKNTQKDRGMVSDITVQDFIKSLQLLEKIFQSPFVTDEGIVLLTKKLRIVLNPYRKIKGDVFVEILKNSLSEYEGEETKIKKKKILEHIDIDNITFEELRTLFSRKSLSKKQLLDIGEKRFGISRGSRERLKKEQLQNLIESCMQNIETLKVIEHKASE